MDPSTIPSGSATSMDNLADDVQSLTLNSSNGKQKNDSQATKLSDDVLVVDTEQAFSSAVLELQQFPTWIVDCEGFNLGSEGGELSILSVRGISSRIDLPPKTFLIDVVLLTGGPPETNCSLRPLFDLLESPSITKVFWDGRMDFCAIYFGYGVEVNTVVDLQVVEMRRRITGENFQKQLQRLMRFFAPRELQNPRKNRKYAHIHVLQGLGGCLMENKVEVKTPKGSVDHDSWMIRPLSDIHLFYAANDVYLIGLLLSHFEEREFIDDEILMQSQRYITVWKDQQPEEGDVFRSNPFFALEILEYDEDSDRKECSGCRRYLSQLSYPYELWNEGAGKRYCHICSLIPIWQRRERFFADLKAKKKEEQENKRIEEEQKKQEKRKKQVQEGRKRTETGSKQGSQITENPEDTANNLSGAQYDSLPPSAGNPEPTNKNAPEDRIEFVQDGQPGVNRNQRGSNRGRWVRGRGRATRRTSGTERETEVPRNGVGDDTQSPRGGGRGYGRRPRSAARVPRGRAFTSRGTGGRPSGNSMVLLTANEQSVPGGSAIVAAAEQQSPVVTSRGRGSGGFNGITRGRGGGRARGRGGQSVPSGSVTAESDSRQNIVASSRGRGSTGGAPRGRTAPRVRGRGSVSVVAS